jgi:tetratricopeptide (TPR) repeat protein
MARVERVRVNWDHWDLASWFGRPIAEATSERLREDPEAFDIRFLEDVLARLGEDADALAQLGHLYTKARRYRDGLAVDRRLVALKPRDPIAHYNLACSLALLKETSRAFLALRKAVRLGYRDMEYMQQDPDLENLRQDPRWNDVVKVKHAP